MKQFLLTLSAAVALAANVYAATGGPDAYGYVWRDQYEPNGPVFNWIDITTRPGVTYTEGLNDDNTVGPYNLNFNFHFYWYDIDQFWIGSNGYIMFQQGQMSAPFPYIPSLSQPNDFMAIMNSDLNFAGTGNTAACYYWVSPAHDTLIVSWVGVPFWDPAPPTYQGTNSFQIILATADSSITYQYLTQTGVYNGGAAVYLSAGIENNSGGVGLQSMVNPISTGTNYFTTPYAVKFYYPASTTYQANDVSALYNNNPSSAGRFLPFNSPNPFQMSCAVKNTGNVNQNPFNVICRVVNNLNQTVVQDNQSTPAMAAGDIANLTMGNTFTPAQIGTYTMRSHTYLPGDIVPANDSLPMELVVLDTTAPPIRLTFDDGGNDGVGLNWQGGNGGAAMEFTPPFYPCKLTTAHFYILANPNIVGFYATVYDDNGVNGSAGTRLDSVYVPPGFITPGWVDVTLTAPIQFNSGKFYVAWNMDGDALSLGQDLGTPISNSSYEVLGNTFAIYRSREFEDLMINCTIDTVFVTTGIPVINDADVFGEFYPNPASHFAVMNFELPAGAAQLSYKLYSSDGRLVHAEDITGKMKGGSKMVLDISGLPNGLYNCAIECGDIRSNRSVVVSH